MKIPKKLKCENCYYYSYGHCEEIIKNRDIEYDYVIVEDDWFCGYFEEE